MGKKIIELLEKAEKQWESDPSDVRKGIILFLIGFAVGGCVGCML